MHFIAALSRGIDSVIRAIGIMASLLFVPLMLIIVYDVVQRKIIDVDNSFVDSLFYLSSTMLQELEWHLHGALFLLALGFALLKDAHVRVDLLRQRFAPRTKIWLELFGAVFLLLPFCWFVVTYGWDFAERAYRYNEVSSAQTGLPARWIIKGLLPVGFVLFGAAGLSVVLKCIVRLSGSTADVGEDAMLGTLDDMPFHMPEADSVQDEASPPDNGSTDRRRPR